MQDSLIDGGTADPQIDANAAAGTPAGTPADDGSVNNAPSDAGNEPPQRPDYVPEKFWDAETGQVRVEGLLKSYQEMEKQRGNVDALKQQWEQERMAARPETPDAYELPQHEAIDSEALASSPIVSLWRRAAHEAGLPQEAFTKVIEDYVQGELDSMAAHKQAQLERLGENATDRTDAVRFWAEKTFEGAELDAVRRIAVDADGVMALERIMAALSERGIDVNGDGDGGNQQDTWDEIQKLMQMPEYWNSSRRDDKIVARVEAYFERQAKKSQ